MRNDQSACSGRWLSCGPALGTACLLASRAGGGTVPALAIDDDRALGFAPPFDVKETPDAFVFRAGLPGVGEADLEVTLTGNRLTISGKSSSPTPTSSGSQSPSATPTSSGSKNPSTASTSSGPKT